MLGCDSPWKWLKIFRRCRIVSACWLKHRHGSECLSPVWVKRKRHPTHSRRDLFPDTFGGIMGERKERVDEMLIDREGGESPSESCDRKGNRSTARGYSSAGWMELGLNHESLESLVKQRIAVQQENKENPAVYPKKSSHTSSLAIYKDNASSSCQHCGIDKSVIGRSVRKAHASVQTSNIPSSDLKEMLCSESARPEYYKELAEQRREALVETLAENKELCDLVEVLQAEITRLSKYEDLARAFIFSVQEADGIEPEMF
nr:expressed protein [Hymenolepis microstoma]